MGFSFLTQELAMDLGTANTVIFQNDQIVLDEPSIVAIDNNTGKAIALGQKAKLMQERENPGIKTVRPMKDGVIADFNAAEMMIRGFIKQVNSRRRSLFTPNIKMVVGIPSGSTEVEIRAVRDSSEHAGGRDVYLIFEPMASALGIGLDVEAPKGNMVVDIGGGTTEIAVISLGGIVVQDSIKVAGDVFKTATNQTPRYAQPGEEGAEGTFILELKVLADVGLVGFPNAGKSTLLSVVSAAKPKIANYAFTTLEPNLGIVSVRDDHSFVMADIPGIIEGAHEGRGLGTRFLRHIERNSVLLFMIPADSDNIAEDYEILLGELTQYNPELLDKRRLLAITKCDMLDDELIEQMRSHLPEGIEAVFISSVANMNISKLKDMLWAALQ